MIPITLFQSQPGYARQRRESNQPAAKDRRVARHPGRHLRILTTFEVTFRSGEEVAESSLGKAHLRNYALKSAVVLIKRKCSALALALFMFGVAAPQSAASPIYIPYAFTNFAGLPGVYGTNDGDVSAARFNGP